MLRSSLSVLASASLLFGSVAVATTPATAASSKTTVKTCVKKKTGEMRYRKKGKKCKKGWKKVSWKKKGRKGAKGATGPRGDQQNVVDGNGKVVGRFIGTFYAGIPILMVLRDGGIYIYLTSGQVLPTDQPLYKSDTCTGTPYTEGSAEEIYAKAIAGAAGSQWRVVYRQDGYGLDLTGPIEAYEYTGKYEKVTDTTLYARVNDVCEARDYPITGYIMALKQTTAPSDAPGPLRIS